MRLKSATTYVHGPPHVYTLKYVRNSKLCLECAPFVFVFFSKHFLTGRHVLLSWLMQLKLLSLIVLWYRGDPFKCNPAMSIHMSKKSCNILEDYSGSRENCYFNVG